MESHTPPPDCRRRSPPPNAGKPWSPAEDERLDQAFAQGAQVAQLASEFGRSRWAVESRLVKLGRLAARGAVPFAAATT